MKTTGKVVTTIFAVLAFAASFVAVTADLDLFQPSAKGATTTVHFIVQPTDTAGTIGDRLQQMGLIRNALLFREYAKYKKLDSKLEPGSYDLSATMTVDQIIATLLHGIPSVVNICIPPGHRLTEYPTFFQDRNLDSTDPAACKSTLVPLFDANGFETAAKSGKLPDGTKVSDAFWYVMPPQKNVAYPLEGYIFADTFQIDTSWDTTAITRHLIAQWGYQLCPGPAANPYQYIHDATQCKAHATQISVGGQKISIFAAMEQQFFTTNDVQAFYDALTLASIVVREAGQNPKDLPAIASVYYNRYYVQVKDGGVSPVDSATLVSFDADPTVWYAYYSDNPPKNGDWWADPQLGPGKQVDPNNPYNTYTHDGLPPGPIAAPTVDDLTAVLQAPAPDQSSNFYFYHDNCGVLHLAQTQSQQDANVAKYQNAKC
jgi:peptidoglycan lytic transglycosylase G